MLRMCRVFWLRCLQGDTYVFSASEETEERRKYRLQSRRPLPALDAFLVKGNFRLYQNDVRRSRTESAKLLCQWFCVVKQHNWNRVAIEELFIQRIAIQ